MANEKAVDREALKAFRERLDERYVIEGEYSPETSVGYSDSTGAIKTEYGVELNAGATIDGHLDEPFLFRPTAYPFNRDVITIGGQKATVKQVRAYAFVKNQLVKYNRSGTWTGTNVYKDINRIKVSDTNRKILIIVDAKSTNSLSQVYVVCRTNGSYAEYHATNYLGTDFTRTTLLFNGSNYDANGIILRISNDGNQENTIEWQNLTVIDLTQWFNNDTTILSKTNETWFVPWFLNNFGKYIPTYSTGEIENTYATQITTNGVNQWDEEYISGGWLNPDGSMGTGYSNRIASKNFIRVEPSRTYYFKMPYSVSDYGVQIGYYDINQNVIDVSVKYGSLQQMPNNCIYIKFATHQQYGSTTYNKDIQICLHWTETEIEQTYHPYEKWVFNIDWSAIGTPLGINSQIGDYKDFVNGKNGKVVGSYTFTGNETWTLGSSQTGAGMYRYYLNKNIGMKSGLALNGICNKYDNAGSNWYTISRDYIMFGLNNIYFQFITATQKTQEELHAIFNETTIIQYELAEPTLTDMTESEKLTNTYNVNDYGTEGLDEVCALDVLYQNNLVRQIVNNQTAIADHEQRISALETEVAGIKGLPTAPSTNGNYRLRCTVADGVATYTWVAES